MKLTKTALLISSALITTPVLAQDGTPKVFGNINAGVIKHDANSDLDGEAFEVTLGAKGLYALDGYKLVYKLEAEMTNATNDGASELEIKNAMLAVPGEYGVFVLGARIESGQQKDMYGAVDIFENNEAHSASVSPIWAQPDEASSLVAYKTPVFSNTFGVIALLTLDKDNQEDVDAVATRIVYKNEDLYLGLGNVYVDSAMLPSSENYNRSTFTASYKFSNSKLGMTWEHNDKHPSGNFDVMGVAADFSFGEGWSAGASYIDKDHDNDNLDNNAVIGIVRKQLHKNIYIYAEAADYDLPELDNFSLGINVSF